jgi:hypothetical protein
MCVSTTRQGEASFASVSLTGIDAIERRECSTTGGAAA